LPLAATATPSEDIKALLEQGKPAEAYELGHGQPDQLGDPLFDFFYGISALDANHAGEGVLALERYLLNFPANRSARFHLARGYFILGEDQRARDEFENLLTDASGAEKIALERYLDAIRARESRYLPTTTGWIEAGIGYDSNLNAGTRSNDLGVLGVISTTSTAIHARDNFTSLAAGIQGTYPIAPGVEFFGLLSGEVRQSWSKQNNIFDPANLGGQAGVSLLQDRNIYRAFVGRTMYQVDDSRFLTNTNLNGDWQYQYDELNRFNLGVQSADLHYTDTFSVVDRSLPAVASPNTVRNASFTALNGGWTRALPALPMQPTVFVGGSYGEEHNHGNLAGIPNNSGVIQMNTRDVYGFRANVSFVPMPQWGASIGFFYQESKYKAPWGAMTDNRRDRYNAIDGSLSYFYSKDITIRAEAAIANQRSNFPLFTYDRDILAIKVRYDFK
jgi:hypothetical protein